MYRVIYRRHVRTRDFFHTSSAMKREILKIDHSKKKLQAYFFLRDRPTIVLSNYVNSLEIISLNVSNQNKCTIVLEKSNVITENYVYRTVCTKIYISLPLIYEQIKESEFAWLKIPIWLFVWSTN